MDPYEKLVNAAISFVSFRPRSEKEIRCYLQEKLTKWNVDSGEILEKVIDRLRKLTYIDDEKFVDWWIEQRTSHRQKGSRFIAQELIHKGIAREIFEEKLTLGNELEKAHAVVAKKASRLQKLPFIEQKKKIYSLLGNRGFSGSTISRVIDEIATLGYNIERKLRY